ncbi:MAG: class I SAM-dependent methyltransferase [Gammaproteobacteria bacterium]|nr:class I SAM-dependent methyltransferase [Gammaproteobacteria bacterium]
MSYQSLENDLNFDKALPVTEHWSAAPDFLVLISNYCLENKPLTIVECSSGTSSLVLSQCCKLSQTGHVYSLENGEEYMLQTVRQLEDFCLSEFCDVIHAPLVDVRLDDESFQWYALDDLPDVEIDMLVIDGPPGFLQKHSRYPALPILGQRLAEHCVVFLDDAARADEQALVKRWLKGSPDFQAEYIENERGCFILKRG